MYMHGLKRLAFELMKRSQHRSAVVSVVWVLWHMYGDGSGAHVERVYVEEHRAQADYALLTEGPTKSTAHEWHLDKVQFIAADGK